MIRDLPGELVVYDTERHRAHCLNRTAAFVFRQADGQPGATEIAGLLGPGADERLVEAALTQLREAGLLEAGPPPPASVSSPAAAIPSRRAVLRQVGLGAALLAPVVTSLLVPTPAEALGTCVPAGSCSGNQDKPCYNNNPGTECLSCICVGSSCSC